MSKRYLLSSEIDRLVLGYLKQCGQTAAYKEFLDNSKYLVDYKECLEEGIEPPTDINGKTLVQILKNGIYCNRGCQEVVADPKPAKVVTESSPQVDFAKLNQKMDDLLALNDSITSLNNSLTKVNDLASKSDLSVKSINTSSASISLNSHVPQSTPIKHPPCQVIRKTPIEQSSFLSQLDYTSPCDLVIDMNPGGTPRKNVTPRKLPQHPNQQSLHTPTHKAAASRVEPDKIVSQLINNPVLPGVLMAAINEEISGPKVQNVTFSPNVIAAQTTAPAKGIEAFNLNPDAIDRIIEEFEHNPEYAEFIDCIMDQYDETDMESSPFTQGASVESSPLPPPPNSRAPGSVTLVRKNLSGDWSTSVNEAAVSNVPFASGSKSNSPGKAIDPGKMFFAKNDTKALNPPPNGQIENQFVFGTLNNGWTLQQMASLPGYQKILPKNNKLHNQRVESLPTMPAKRKVTQEERAQLIMASNPKLSRKCTITRKPRKRTVVNHAEKTNENAKDTSGDGAKSATKELKTPEKGRPETTTT